MNHFHSPRDSGPSTHDPTPISAALPKAELHCHTDALLDAAMLRETDPALLLAPVTPEELEAVCPSTSWDHWIATYGTLVDRAMTHPLILATMDRHFRRLVEQNVVYAEAFVCGCMMLKEPVEKTVALYGRVKETIERAVGGKMTTGLVACIGRGPRDRAERQFARIFALRQAGLICGVSLAGDEGACTIESIHDLLDRARETGMGIEIHAGEMRGPESVREALEWGRPERIGHGLAAFEDPALVDLIGERGIHLEFCPTSNRILTAHKDIRSHPIVRAHALGLSYSINTDDPAPFSCSMNSEFALLEGELGFGPDEFDRILKQSVAAGFAGR